ncbi:sugar transferase [Georgenia sp. TF02-10]|nr:sugar transferase [Georgenia sp. TF02-10]
MLRGATDPWVGLLAALLAAAAVPAAVWAHGGYAPDRTATGPAEDKAVLRAGTVVALAAVALSHLTALDAPPALPLLAPVAAVAVMVLGRLVLRAQVRRARRHGRLLRPTLVAGDAAAVGGVLAALREDRGLGLDPVGLCTTGPVDTHAAAGVPVLGSLPDLPQLVAEAGAEVLLVHDAALPAAELRRLTWLMEGSGVELMLAPNLLEVAAGRVTVQAAGGATLLRVRTGATRRQVRTKAAVDRLAGAAALLLAGPVLLVCAAAVRLTSPGPALYRQTRVGVDGAPFTMLKLRTMSVDADRRLAELAAADEGNGVLFKIRRDPRVTPLGRVLRRYSLDELPQLINVVRGEMSLVGPRPPLPHESEKYDTTERRRLKVRPGLTGLWQVSGRSDLSWPDTVRLDLRYVDNWSPAGDLGILGRTVGAVLGGRGAY